MTVNSNGGGKAEVLTLQQGISRRLATAASGNFTKIPVIDLEALTNPSASAEDKNELVAQVRDACTRVGFFIIKNHGIDWKIVEGAFEGLEEFFNLPHEKKMEIHQDASPSYMGYEQMYYTNVDGTKKGDKKEGVSIAYNPEIDPQGIPKAEIPELLRRENFWPKPEDSPKFRRGVEAYQIACLGLMRKLIRLMALAIGVEETFFDKKSTYPIASVRCLYYPPQEPSNETETGLGAHTDIQLMTMIAQKPYDQPALEVLNAQGQWIKPVLEDPECFVVNLSDMTSRLTNDVFQSTIHRVRNNTNGAQSRYSLPFFFGLNQDEVTTTLPQFVTEENPLQERYEQGMTGFEHYNNRMHKAHHKHPHSQGQVSAALPVGMSRVDGIVVEGL
ncbi:Clavaminate synthase-like protein [Thozetella sp. PMI_491]|nr:Clavaminate synthase-like protein [Thozetella sp. PMI_491]